MRYLTAEEIVKINVKLIRQLSEGELVGVKDPAALDMTVNQPKQEVFSRELCPTIYDKAVILVINLVKRHPFHNANKRTALVALLTFFKMNGQTINFSREEAVQFILEITTSDKAFDQLKDTVSANLKVQAQNS